MLENNKNLTCEFAEELVSYLYDELATSDKARFEKHLSGCSLCAEELPEFSMARSSILEWRNEEFLPLPTPIIEIPYEKKPLIAANESGSRSWFASVRDFFTLSPAWMTTATALAALTIFVGLALVMFSALPDDKDVMVQTNEKNVKVVPSPTTGTVSNVSDSKVTGQTVVNSPKPPSINTPDIKEVTTPVKSSTVPKQNLTVKKQIPPTKTNKPQPNTRQKPPGLVDDEEEDDGLRLSDLLEEIGMYSDREKKEVNR